LPIRTSTDRRRRGQGGARSAGRANGSRRADAAGGGLEATYEAQGQASAARPVHPSPSRRQAPAAFLTACTFASVFRIGQATGNTRAARPCKIQKLGNIADLDNLNLDKAALFASCPFNWPRLYALKTHVHWVDVKSSPSAASNRDKSRETSAPHDAERAISRACAECLAEGLSAAREVPFISRRAFSFRSKM
jgi:hypothetical protein